jgi:anti-sigma factor RsiW
MKCKKANKLLSDYLDHLLSPARWRRFEEHLKKCPACRSRLQAAEKLRGLLKLKGTELPPESYRESFWPRLKERLGSSPASPAPGFRFPVLPPFWKPAYSVALGSAFIGALLIYAGFVLLGEREPGAREEIFHPPVAPLAPAPSDFMVASARLPGGGEETEPDYILGCGRPVEPDREADAASDREFVLASASLAGETYPVYW